MLSNVVGCPPEEVHCGMAVVVTWEPLSDGRQLPLFTAGGRRGMSVPETKAEAITQGLLHAWWAERVPDRLAVSTPDGRPHLRGLQRQHQPAGTGPAGPGPGSR